MFCSASFEFIPVKYGLSFSLLFFISFMLIISYKPENVNKWVRGRTLGSDYEKGAIEYEHERYEKQQRKGEAIFDWNEFERCTTEHRYMKLYHHEP